MSPFNYASKRTHDYAVTDRLIATPFSRFLGLVTLAIPAVLDANTITLEAGHGVTAGEVVALSEEDTIYLGTVLLVETNVITLATPLNRAFSVEATGFRVRINMNEDGSSTHVTYSIAPSSYKWVANRFLVAMKLTGEPDDGTFGDLDALTNGLVLRVCRNGSDRQNLFNFQDNSDFRLAAYDVTYNARTGPQGTYGMNVRLTFGGVDKFARPITLDSATNDCLQLIIQDDLEALVQIHAIVEGHERQD